MEPHHIARHVVRLGTRFGLFALLARTLFGQRIASIVWLTWKAALRFRLFWVLTVLLVGSVIVLPLVIKDDGTARGFTQILLTYTLSIITALLGLSTLWLSCGTLARDIDENQMQMVAVKPVARWQIWFGKWLGLVSLNAVLLSVAGVCILTLMQWRARQLPPNEQRILREEVLVARGSLKEPPVDIEQRVEQVFQERTRDLPVNPETAPMVKNQLREALKVDAVRPGYLRRWHLNLGLQKALLRDQPLFARFKFYAANTNDLATYYLRVESGPTNAPVRSRLDRTFAASAFHEIRLTPNLWDESGNVTVDIMNRSDNLLVFPLEDGFEILYREAGFALNFARALFILLCWLGLLAAIGLAAASFLSFPVAAFVSASLLLVALSSGTLASAVEAGSIMGVDEESGQAGHSVLDAVLIPVFKVLLGTFRLVEDFSPIDALGNGRSVSWGTVAQAFGQIILLMGGCVALLGISIFNRRELAAGNNQS